MTSSLDIEFDKNFLPTIGGKLVDLDKKIDVTNPADEEIIASVPDAGSDQLDAAIHAASEAFERWKFQSFEQRGQYVCKLGDLIHENAEQFMRLLTREQGKPRSDAKWEVDGSIAWCHEVGQQALPADVIEDNDRHRVELHRVPLGVVAAITPWNFPLLLAVWKVAPALVAGNTMVLKPSPFTPLCTLKLGEISSEVLPPGVLNVLSGGDELGRQMTADPRISKVAFTGSTETGKRVAASAASSLKRLTLELGGNDPAIVLPDVDIEGLTPKLFWAAFANNAQFCVAAKRLYVHEDIYDEFLDSLIAYAKGVKVGDGSVPETQLGPIQNREQFDRIRNLLEDIKSGDQRISIGGDLNQNRGFFLPVTIVDNPPDDSRVVKEEAFGPILPVLRWSSDDDVIARANHTSYGLAASVWGQNIARAYGIARRLEAGTVWVNEVHEFSPHIPFGGHKESGLGVENALEGLAEYTNPQTIMIAK